MRIIDTFLFSEPYEVEVFLIKLNLEYEYVDKFILIENSFSFQGDFKGLHANKIIENDLRFKEFKDKIYIISNNVNQKNLDKNTVNDDMAFNVEFWQRDSAYEYIIKNYASNDYIIISDVDEAIDFSNSKRRLEVFEKIKKKPGKIIQLPVRRYWYDIDNQYNNLYVIPLVPISLLFENRNSISLIRKTNRTTCKEDWKNIIGFEYSHCFKENDIIRKYFTFAHTGYTLNEIRQALRCNHRPVSALRSFKLQYNDNYFFQKVKLNNKNAPQYVLNNFKDLKTNVVDENYKLNRKNDYPDLLTWKNILKRKALFLWKLFPEKFKLILKNERR